MSSIVFDVCVQSIVVECGERRECVRSRLEMIVGGIEKPRRLVHRVTRAAHWPGHPSDVTRTIAFSGETFTNVQPSLFSLF